MSRIAAGKPAIEFVKLCYRANRSPLLVGQHGVGKSELFEQAAKELGIEIIVRDLSLMEPPDLIGLPKPNETTTKFLVPDFLPTKGQGLLVFEELNRCEPYMRAPCLQLLTARSLNDYHLPDGWLPAAAVNPSGGDYEVADLDPALLSRFVKATVVPDQKRWLAWADRNGVDPSVRGYVASDPKIFQQPESNPRAWKCVSDILAAAESSKAPRAVLRAAIAGLVGDKRAAAFLSFVKKGDRPVAAADILGSYSKYHDQIVGWVNNGQLDLVDGTLLNLRKHLQAEVNYDQVKSDRERWKNLGRFLEDLPGDILARAKKFFGERGYKFPMRVKRKTA